MGFYGNNIIAHIPRSHFDIALTVANRTALEDNDVLSQVDLYDYILIDYNHGSTDGNTYNTNRNIDIQTYAYDYHNTIWQKGYKLITTITKDEDDNDIRTQSVVPGVIAIAKIDSVLPTYYQDNNPVTPFISTMNQIPLVVNEPFGFDNFGTAEANIPDGFIASGQIEVVSPIIKNGKEVHTPIENEFIKYGTETYTYLTK